MSTPRLSVHLMTLNAASVIERTLRSLAAYPGSEVCLVDTGSTDCTPDLVAKICFELGLIYKGIAISPTSRPDLYFPDLQASFNRPVPGPFTGRPVLRDWSAARNLGLDLCTGQYVLKLDADDTVVGSLDKALGFMDRRSDILALSCPYEIMDPVAGVTEYITTQVRLWRHSNDLRFREVCHEVINLPQTTDRPNWFYSDELIRARDWKDSSGVGIRLPNRNYKVLLREFEAAPASSNHLTIYLADEACTVDPELALSLTEVIPQLHPIDHQWIRWIRGRALEQMGDVTGALGEYAQATTWPRAALRRSMLRYQMGIRNHGLAFALADAGRRLYPIGASRSDMREAELLVKQPTIRT